MPVVLKGSLYFVNLGFTWRSFWCSFHVLWNSDFGSCTQYVFRWMMAKVRHQRYSANWILIVYAEMSICKVSRREAKTLPFSWKFLSATNMKIISRRPGGITDVRETVESPKEQKHNLAKCIPSTWINKQAEQATYWISPIFIIF
jgi:hypothetical protein